MEKLTASQIADLIDSLQAHATAPAFLKGEEVYALKKISTPGPYSFSVTDIIDNHYVQFAQPNVWIKRTVLESFISSGKVSPAEINAHKILAQLSGQFEIAPVGGAFEKAVKDEMENIKNEIKSGTVTFPILTSSSISGSKIKFVPADIAEIGNIITYKPSTLSGKIGKGYTLDSELSDQVKAKIGPSPIKRFRNNMGMSLEKLAKNTGLTIHAVHLNELGCYPRVLPAIKSYILENSSISPDELDTMYEEYVQDKRKVHSELLFMNNKPTFSFMADLPPIPSPDIHPVVDFRKYLGFTSAISFCKFFLLQPASQHALEKGKLQSLPKQMKTAMRQMRFDEELIDELDYRSREFALDALSKSGVSTDPDSQAA